jgi:hypothetical protein
MQGEVLDLDSLSNAVAKSACQTLVSTGVRDTKGAKAKQSLPSNMTSTFVNVLHTDRHHQILIGEAQTAATSSDVVAATLLHNTRRNMLSRCIMIEQVLSLRPVA